MIVYYILLAIIFIPYVFYLLHNEKNSLEDTNGYKIFRRNHIIIISLYIIFISGFRSILVGNDTINYYNNFLYYSHLSELPLNLFTEVEPGFKIFTYICSHLGFSYNVYMLLESMVYIGSFSVLIYKYSDSYVFSFFLLLSTGIVTFGMTAQRQSMAIGFSIFSFLLLGKSWKRNILSLLLVIVAISFHVTAAIVIPGFLLYKLKISKKTLLIMVSTGFVIFIFKSQIIGLLNTHARDSYDEKGTGGIITYLFYLSTVIVSFISMYGKKNNKNDEFSFFSVFAGVLLWPVMNFNSTVYRLGMYFLSYRVILIPNMLNLMKGRDYRFLGYLIYTIAGIILMKYTIFYSESYFVDYRFSF